MPRPWPINNIYTYTASTSSITSNQITVPYWTCSNSTITFSYNTTYSYGTLRTREGWFDLGYIADDGIITTRVGDGERAFPDLASRQERAEQQRRETAIAHDRAAELLLAMLTPEQRESFRRNKQFELVGSHGTRYRIEHGVAGNVVWLDPEGNVGGRLCAHPDMRDCWLPTADVMLGQMLALTTDEAEFVRVANVHRGARPQLALVPPPPAVVAA